MDMLVAVMVGLMLCASVFTIPKVVTVSVACQPTTTRGGDMGRPPMVFRASRVAVTIMPPPASTMPLSTLFRIATSWEGVESVRIVRITLVSN